MGGFKDRSPYRYDRFPWKRNGPAHRIRAIADRIARDRRLYREDMKPIIEKLIRKFSSNYNQTAKAFDETLYHPGFTGMMVGGFYKGRGRYEIKSEFWDYYAKKEGASFSYIDTGETWSLLDRLNDSRVCHESDLVEAVENKIKVTGVSRCDCCGKFHRIDKHFYTSGFFWDRYPITKCKRCRSIEVNLHKREADLKECRRLMRNIKNITKVDKHEKHQRA